MSLKLSTASGEIKRQDAFLLNPHDIIVDPAFNGRVDDHDEATVKELAESMHVRGQVQPVKIRRVGGDQPQLICGFRRRAAAIYIREHLDPKFMLAATVQNCNEEEAFILNIVENRQRRATSAIDDAHNARRLRERYGMDDAKIVGVLQCAPSWLTTLGKLVLLPTDLQKKVADGLIAATVAAKLTALGDDDAMRAVVKAAEGSGGKVKTSMAAEALREKGGKVGRTLADVKKFLTVRGESSGTDGCPISIVLLAFIRGEIDEVEADQKLNDEWLMKK